MPKWRSFWVLSFREQFLVSLAVVVFPLARFGLHWLGFGKLLIFLKRISPAICELDESRKKQSAALIGS